jgi:hypothetical protein
MKQRKQALPLLGAAIALLLAAGCADAPREPATDRFEVTGKDQFSYTVTASYLRPLNDEQAEHRRLVALRRHVRAAGICPNGYHVVRDPPMEYGSVNQRMTERIVRDVTYSGVCDG